MFPKIAIFAALIIVSPCAALADESTPLVELCKSWEALPKGGEVTSDYIQLKSSCVGFINSAFRMSKPEDGFCRPAHYNMDDLAKHYMAWATQHPERWKEPTKVTIADALKDAYPCEKGS